MRDRKEFKYYLKKAAQGVFASILILAVFLIINRGDKINELLLYEVLPDYGMESGKVISEPGLESIDTEYNNTNPDDMEKPEDDAKPESVIIYNTEYIEIVETAIETVNDSEGNSSENGLKPEEQVQEQVDVPLNVPETIETGSDLVDNTAVPEFKVTEVESTHVESEAGIIGLDDVIYQPESYTENIEGHFSEAPAIDVEKLMDMNYLLNNFYLVDPKTGLRDGLIDPVAFLEEDMRIKSNVNGPQVLVFHTHSQEMFKDSNGLMEGIMGAGELLCQILESKYGIKTMHDMSTYDLIDGKSHILGAYERMEPNIRKTLRDNPTIEVAVDLHRDGVSESIHLVDMINGKPTAQIMFFNGLSTINENGLLKDVASLPNENLKSNLAFSFQMQLAANQLYEGFTRKVYLQAYRYSLHMLPKSLLIEVGAQTNTKEEAFNAMEPLADVLAKVLLSSWQ